MGIPHILVIPYPAQGHVMPLMELSQSLLKHGFKITFVNSEHTHIRVTKAFEKKDEIIDDGIRLVSIPDGLELWEDRTDLGRLTESIFEVMPRMLEELINKINIESQDKITCVLADMNVGWALDVAEKMKIRRAAFWPAAASLLILNFNIQKLIDDGVIDEDGTPIKHDMIQLAPKMPNMNPTNFVWACIGDLTTQKIVVSTMKRNKDAGEKLDWIICNSTYDLETPSFCMMPKIIPIGPLSTTNQIGNVVANFWKEDSTCLNWLNQQPPKSVIYVAFGSFTVLDQVQFQELALGLELSNKPFLWVVRPDFTEEVNDAYPKGFLERVGERGHMVGWAPQQKVLSHPSIACFLSHCGWNSTIEGVSNGLPFLCWPYFADQFLNESYICDIWRIGLRFNQDGKKIITQEEIKDKIEELLGDESLKERALDLKEMTSNSVKEGGCSDKNFKNFIEWIKS